MSNEKISILIVDDDPDFISFLNTTLDSVADYDVVSCTSPDDALHALDKAEYDLIISDFRMPGMDGVTFLKKVNEIIPDAIRIIISSFSDRDVLFGAINEARVHRYIVKPLEADVVLAIVDDVIEEHLNPYRNTGC